MKRGTVADRLGAVVDRAIGVVSPLRQLRRTMARQAIAKMSARQAYDGAKTERRWHNRLTTSGSPDADLDGDTLAELRERSRDRYRNDGVARAAIDSLTDNVVGTGLRPILALPWERLGITEKKARQLRLQATEIWEGWGERCESTMRLGIEEIQAQVFSQVLVNGDVLVLPVMRQSRQQPTRYDLKLEIVEGDRLDSPLGDTSPNIRNGVELNAAGEPVAYYIAEEHPGDAGLPGAKSPGLPNYVRRPAFSSVGRANVLHVYVQERPGQSRGCPVLAPVLDTLKDRHDGFEAEIVAAQVSSCAAAFVKKADPYTAMLARSTDDTRSRVTRHEELSPGAIFYLGPGEDVSFGSPSHPTSNFEAFIRSVTRDVCSALGLPLEVALRDFHDTTYSQARAALLESRRLFQRRQRWMPRVFLTPVWRMLLEEAWARGDFAADGSFLERMDLWTRCVWVPPGWGWIDPEAEVNSYEKAIKLGLMTRQQAVSSMDGGDWEDVARKLADEKELMDELGIAEQPEAPAPAAAPAQQPAAAARRNGVARQTNRRRMESAR